MRKMAGGKSGEAAVLDLQECRKVSAREKRSCARPRVAEDRRPGELRKVAFGPGLESEGLDGALVEVGQGLDEIGEG